MSRLIIGIALVLVLTHLGGGWHATAAAPGATPVPRHASPITMSERQAETTKILSALGRRVPDPVILRRAADKLATLNNGQVHLIMSLSERVADEGRTAADVALLLLTALLILS